MDARAKHLEDLIGLLTDSLQVFQDLLPARSGRTPRNGDAEPPGIPIHEKQIRGPAIEGPDNAYRLLPGISRLVQGGIPGLGDPKHTGLDIQETLCSCHSQPHSGLYPRLKAISTV